MKIAFFDVYPADEAYVRQHYPDSIIIAEPLSPESVDQAHDATTISIFVPSRASKEVLEKLPKLEHIICRSTGYDNVDLEVAHKRKITVCNVPAYGENTVAEYAFALLLALARKLPPAIDQVRHGAIDHTLLTGVDLMGKTLGVIGTGRIGTHTISIGRGFGMKVIGFDAFQKPELEGQLGFRYVDLDDLLKESDFISLHAPLTPDTAGMFDASMFKKMKPTALLVNTSRGELIDTTALVQALSTGQIGGVALDVIEQENLLEYKQAIGAFSPKASQDIIQAEAEQALLEKMPNVILSPHNAYNTAEAVRRIWDTSFANIGACVNGTPQNVVKTGA
ncbi:hydroxyacid dehydrogenase [Candidatus Saccharibacteria bacterium]|nr:hydroxyacid dehydrogenase [Candidatus Saccharibacteria bacterium]